MRGLQRTATQTTLLRSLQFYTTISLKPEHGPQQPVSWARAVQPARPGRAAARLPKMNLLSASELRHCPRRTPTLLPGQDPLLTCCRQ